MFDRLTATVDDQAVSRALEQLPAQCQAAVRPIARATAHRIAAEQRRRVRRRTGHTAAQIRVEDDYAGVGFVVLAHDQAGPPVEQWLEDGTRFMTPRPFFYAPADLEAGAYDRAIRDAIQDVIDTQGMGS